MRELDHEGIMIWESDHWARKRENLLYTQIVNIKFYCEVQNDQASRQQQLKIHLKHLEMTVSSDS